jgi:hypothetical protein
LVVANGGGADGGDAAGWVWAETGTAASSAEPPTAMAMMR